MAMMRMMGGGPDDMSGHELTGHGVPSQPGHEGPADHGHANAHDHSDHPGPVIPWTRAAAPMLPDAATSNSSSRAGRSGT
jgi:hypothetical protein